jgi:hypothetical protein
MSTAGAVVRQEVEANVYRRTVHRTNTSKTLERGRGGKQDALFLRVYPLYKRGRAYPPIYTLTHGHTRRL